MAQHYSNPKRADDPHALPDVETWQAQVLVCPDCDREYPCTDGDHDEYCPECNVRLGVPILGPNDSGPKMGWWYWFCFPGCLPDGEPMGPYATEEEALEDARDGMEEE